jgi:branched-chain amino acid transport system ATP-binding protein
MLRLDDVSAAYRGLKALQGITMQVTAGEIVAVVGANGAGKSTLLKSIAGQVPSQGTISLEGKPLGKLPPHRICRMGVGLVPEGRRLFPRLSVEDNLRLGAYARRGEADRFAPFAGASAAARRDAVGRRAADAGDRPCLDDQAAFADA